MSGDGFFSLSGGRMPFVSCKFFMTYDLEFDYFVLSLEAFYSHTVHREIKV
jgi:hypothetical protein